MVTTTAVAFLLGGLTACSSGSDDGGASRKTASTAKYGGAAETTTTTAKPSDDAPEVAEPGTYAVGAHTETWVDETRETNANGKVPAKPERTFETLVLYPAEGTGSVDRQVVDAEPAPGPWPLVLFSHGVTGQGKEYGLSLQVLASAGYVVVAPNYPLSNRNTPGGATVIDMPNQAKGDVPFLLDQALAANDADGYLHDLIDPERVGLLGHSLGAVTSITATLDPCCAEDRVDALAEWSGVLVPLTTPFKVDAAGQDVPVLIVHGTDDGTVPYSSAAKIYDTVTAPKLEVSLQGEAHVPAFVTGRGTPASTVVVDTSVAFFDAELKDDAEGLDRVKAVVDDAGPDVATLREDLG